MLTVADVIRFLQHLAPTQRAADWDNVGLILGSRSAAVRAILTCLTVTPEVVAEAVSAQASLLVAHHPMLFRPTRKLTDATVEGRMVVALLQAGIAVYSAHTAYDNCAGGINDQLAAKLGLLDVTCLRPFESVKQFKFVTFVPEQGLGRVAEALFAAGAGNIGKYSQCSFRSAGTGTFFGNDGSNPSVGEKGRREEAAEWRLETVCPETAVEALIAALRKTHSYEEPAFDVIPLRSTRGLEGEGRVGRLSQAQSLTQFAMSVRAILGCGPVQTVGEPNRRIERAAAACGAGGEFLNDASEIGADVFVTGEMRFHDYLAARAQDIALVLPGHFATERFGMESLAQLLRNSFPDIEIAPSQSERDPVAWV